jgi:hypothetical protein
MNSPLLPPIPEATPPRASTSSQPGVARPRLLDAFVGLQVVLSVLALWLLDPSRTSIGAAGVSGGVPDMDMATRAFNWIFMAAYAVVVYFLWRGRNWARIVVMLSAALSLFNVLLASMYSDRIAQAFIIFSSLVGAAELFWLSRPKIAAYFKSSPD